MWVYKTQDNLKDIESPCYFDARKMMEFGARPGDKFSIMVSSNKEEMYYVVGLDPAFTISRQTSA